MESRHETCETLPREATPPASLKEVLATKLVTATEMRRLDSQAIEGLGIPSLVLMENAGRCVAQAALWMLRCLHCPPTAGAGARGAPFHAGTPAPSPSAHSSPRRPLVVVVAGRGNNGGDGLVAARHLLGWGVPVKVLLFCSRGDLSGDAAVNLKALEAWGVDPEEAAAPGAGPAAALATGDPAGALTGAASAAALASADLVIDALLGTGARGAPSGAVLDAVRLINASRKPVLSIDIPTGLDPDTGRIPGECVRATITVTLGLPKPGLAFSPGAEAAGRVLVAEIGLPPRLAGDEALTGAPALATELVEPAWVAERLPARPRDAHKGTCGWVLMVAGSVGYTGAAALAGLAALRAGAGLVTLALPSSLNDLMEVKVTEVITRPLPETVDRTLGPQSLAEALRLAADADVLALGPGLSPHAEASELARDFLLQTSQPLVVDADGLRPWEGRLEALAARPGLVVLTPHPGEMARLMGLTVAEVRADPLGVARAAAARAKCTVVLKGAPTVVAWPDGRAFVTSSGNPGMATAGMGDVLTGAIAALCAQGMPLPEAAVAGVYLHGLAGDLAARRCGPRGLLAGDLLDTLPAAQAWLLGWTGRGGGRGACRRPAAACDCRASACLCCGPWGLCCAPGPGLAFMPGSSGACPFAGDASTADPPVRRASGHGHRGAGGPAGCGCEGPEGGAPHA